MRMRKLLSFALLLVGLQQLASAGMITAKAQLAQALISSAWEKTLVSGGAAVKPWPWADTWPVARLEIPRHQVDLYVLAGMSGNVLAFGPGLERTSATSEHGGLTVIGGHRDTHFKFLKGLKANTLLSLQLPSGERRDYRVSTIRVVDTQQEPRVRSKLGRDELLLVTCYPFETLLPGGPLRYVVSATPLSSSISSSFSPQHGAYSL